MSVEPEKWDATFTYWAERRANRARAGDGSAAIAEVAPRAIAKPAPKRQPKRASPVAVSDPPKVAPPAVIRNPPLAATAVAHGALQTYAPEFTVRLEDSGQREYRRGIYVVAVAFGFAGVAAGLLPLSGGVITSGSVVSASSVKTVQPPIGGVIREILVGDGAMVDAGQVLVRLDATVASANLKAVAQRLQEIRATIQRLTAERDNKEISRTDLAPVAGIGEGATSAAVSAQAALFESRTNSRQQQIVLLKDHVAQLRLEQTSAQMQLESKTAERESVLQELAGVEPLFDQHLVTLSRVTALRRDKAQLDGAIGAFQAAVAGSRSKIAEAELQVAHFRQEFQTQVLSDLNDAQTKEGDLAGQQTAALQQLQLLEVRAPEAGTVHELAVHTIGGVVSPAETLMLIAPEDDDLQIEAEIQPKDIDQITVGQTATLRFAAFDRNSTPELHGTVAYVSPDATRDAHSNLAIYRTRISIEGSEIRRLGELHLIAGMPAEIVLSTRSRTLMSYLFKPLTDQMNRAFRGR